MKKYLKIENLLYLFILLSPFLDSFSFIYRNINPSSTISPITILRPIIPIILAIYLFFKHKDSRKTLIIGSVIYFIYAFIHLFIYNNNITLISFGGLLHEAQYTLNYTYMIFLLYIFIKFNDKIDVDKLNKVLVVTLFCYLILIYLSLITNTSSYTYVEEKIGYKGWNTSGNSIGTVLLLIEALVLPFIMKKGSKIKLFGIFTLVLLGIFLTFILGTRTGLFGFYLIIVLYFIGNIVINFIRKSNLDLKKHLVPILIVLSLGIILVTLIGSNTLLRRNNLKEIQYEVIDPNTNDVSHVTGDTAEVVYKIKNNMLEDGYMLDSTKDAYLSMYDFANKNKILNSDLRTQQLIYHLNLIRYQKNIGMILFGNGYEINAGEMTLEMEILAILFNFGIFGFILYLIPFIIIDFKAIKYAFKNIRNIEVDYIMYLFASLLAYILSFMAGYTFFNPSSALIIIIIHMILRKKYND